MDGPADSFLCSRCSVRHQGPPRSFHADAPQLWSEIPEDERASRGQLSEEQCVIDGRFYFVHGLIRIPVLGEDEAFEWGVWVSLSEKSWDRTCELWETPGRESEPPYFGWLSTELPLYPSTLNLKTHVHTRPVGLRPLIELEPTDHPLAIEQRQGIRPARLRDIAETLLHS
jgi:hypothetical protein